MQLNAKTQRLARIAPLSVIESDALRLLAFDGVEMALEPQSVLFRQGDAADGGYVVMSGSVALERDGEVPAPARLMKSGSLIGLSALIVKLERPTTATAREKSLLLKLPRRLVLRVLEAFPDSALTFKQYIEDSLAAQASALERIASSIDAVAANYKLRESRIGT
ncbi:MAG: cyclic nucleotide-binding domain-containing protein [Hyphomicrobiales bacterium]|nr:cyclic nucleotide-binding domain-containing protein [Hyphomicrobiales bacterium]